MASRNSFVKLNLRGTWFETLSSTLSKDPDSLLCQMMKPESSTKPFQIQDGSYFFDRNPDRFEIILDYLNKGELNSEIPKRELIDLEDEAKYFNLQKLQKEIRNKIIQLEAVVKINVSGKIFQVSKHTLIKYPDSILAQYIKGTKKPLFDADGNIFLNRIADTYRIIFNCLEYGTHHGGHRNLLISGDINLLMSIREEADYLKLDVLAKAINVILQTRLKKYPFILLKDAVCGMAGLPSKQDGTLKARVMDGEVLYKDENGNIYIDITAKEMDILYSKWENIIITSNGKNSTDPVIILAKKLGILKEDERLV